MAKQKANMASKKAAKKAKRKNILRERKQQDLAIPKSPLKKAMAACDFAVSHCFYGSELFETGMGTVVIARRTSGYSLAVSLFLLDVFCLGVKNAIFREFSSDEFEDLKSDLYDSEEMVDCEPEFALKLVQATAAYGSDLGFKPDKDYPAALALFGDTDPSLCETEFNMGQDGKPHFIPGPNDSNAKIRNIIKNLDKSVGQGNYDFVLPTDAISDMMM